MKNKIEFLESIIQSFLEKREEGDLADYASYWKKTGLSPSHLAHRAGMLSIHRLQGIKRGGNKIDTKPESPAKEQARYRAVSALADLSTNALVVNDTNLDLADRSLHTQASLKAAEKKYGPRK